MRKNFKMVFGLKVLLEIKISICIWNVCTNTNYCVFNYFCGNFPLSLPRERPSSNSHERFVLSLALLIIITFHSVVNCISYFYKLSCSCCWLLRIILFILLLLLLFVVVVSTDVVFTGLTILCVIKFSSCSKISKFKIMIYSIYTALFCIWVAVKWLFASFSSFLLLTMSRVLI